MRISDWSSDVCSSDLRKLKRRTAVRAADAMIPVHYHVHPDHPLREAFTRMRSDGVDVLPVIDADEVVGLLTLADVRGDSTAWEVDVDRTAVRDVMTDAFTWGLDRKRTGLHPSH